MISVLIALAVSALPNAPSVPLTVTVKRSECSSSKNTAYIKFKATMHCLWDYRKNGCYGTFDIDLDDTEPDGQGGLRRKYLCLVPSTAPKPAPVDIESELSGVKLAYPINDGTAYFNNMQFTTWVESYNPGNGQVQVGVWTNWSNSTGTMMDDFTAEITGELIWTTNTVSRLIRSKNGCSGVSSSVCGGRRSVTLPAGEVLGGTAFSSVLIGVTGTAPDVALSGFRFETTSQPLPTGYSHAEYGEISTNSPVGVRFVRESLTLVGQAQEVVRLHPPPFSRSDYYPFAGSVSVPNVPLSALRCGLRYVKFDVGGRGQDMKLGAFSAGLDSIDCGWDPSVSFVGFGFWDWRLSDPLDFNATPPYVEQYLGNFGVEATRLP